MQCNSRQLSKQKMNRTMPSIQFRRKKAHCIVIIQQACSWNIEPAKPSTLLHKIRCRRVLPTRLRRKLFLRCIKTTFMVVPLISMAVVWQPVAVIVLSESGISLITESGLWLENGKPTGEASVCLVGVTRNLEVWSQRADLTTRRRFLRNERMQLLRHLDGQQKHSWRNLERP